VSGRRPEFREVLAAIAVAALAVRLAYVLGVMDGVSVHGDGLQFHLLANLLVEKHRYLAPGPFLHGRLMTTADKPPLFPLFLAIPSSLGWSSIAAHRVASSLLGCLTVVLIGLLGRKVHSERAGLIAAGVAAVYPMLVVLDGSLRSESLYAPLIALILLAAYRLLEFPTPARAAGLGALIGLATLTRSEALALLLLLVVPLVRLTSAGRRLALFGVAALCALIVVAPWAARNWEVFGRPLLSTNSGTLLYGANCHAAYYSPLIGTWPCFPNLSFSRSADEAEIERDLRQRGLDYADSHAGRLPAVVGVRLLRIWELWTPRAQARLEMGISDRNLRAQQIGVLAYYLLLGLAAFGSLRLHRLGRPLRILLAPALLVGLLGMLAYGTTRFRVPAEISIVVLAGVAIAELVAQRGPAAYTR
jgi:4-amino-4-deoxy-L-arabinose transferase-like glycosyltransferase